MASAQVSTWPQHSWSSPSDWRVSRNSWSSAAVQADTSWSWQANWWSTSGTGTNSGWFARAPWSTSPAWSKADMWCQQRWNREDETTTTDMSCQNISTGSHVSRANTAMPSANARLLDNDGGSPDNEDRAFVANVNRMATATSSSGFGDTIPPDIEDPFPPSANQQRRVLAFAQAAASRWSDHGKLCTFQRVSGQTVVDRRSQFWRDCRQRYLQALTKYIYVLSDPSNNNLYARFLPDLGFHLHADFITEDEEAELLAYWSEASVCNAGAVEHGSNRRFFHYGPVLVRTLQGSSKSTLSVVPALCGSMPPPVLRMGLAARIRRVASHLGDALMGFDQLYVNSYTANDGARIDFHHDNPRTMGQVVAGISLMSACEFHLMPLDRELPRDPIRVTLPRRSLYLMSGLSRYHLQHGIPEINEDRLSMTFRTVERESLVLADSWKRPWSDIPVEEAVNAHWPLLPPTEETVPDDAASVRDESPLEAK